MSSPVWLLLFVVLERKEIVSPKVSPLSRVCKRMKPPFFAPDARFAINSSGSVFSGPLAWLHNTRSAVPSRPAGAGPDRGSH